jgi:hypothetical protein
MASSASCQKLRDCEGTPVLKRRLCTEIDTFFLSLSDRRRVKTEEISLTRSLTLKGYRHAVHGALWAETDPTQQDGKWIPILMNVMYKYKNTLALNVS